MSSLSDFKYYYYYFLGGRGEEGEGDGGACHKNTPVSAAILCLAVGRVCDDTDDAEVHFISHDPTFSVLHSKEQSSIAAPRGVEIRCRGRCTEKVAWLIGLDNGLGIGRLWVQVPIRECHVSPLPSFVCLTVVSTGRRRNYWTSCTQQTIHGTENCWCGNLM